MAYWENYYTPGSVREAVDLLHRYHGDARIIGGGTDLLLEIQQGHREGVKALVDLSKIPGLDKIREEDGYFVVGAGVTHTQIVEDPRMIRHATCLVESRGVIGGLRPRPSHASLQSPGARLIP